MRHAGHSSVLGGSPAGAGVRVARCLLAGCPAGAEQGSEPSQLTQSSQLCLQPLTIPPLASAEEREQEEAARREKARLQEMDEEEYDALTEEQKAQFDDSILHVQRERKKRSVSSPVVSLRGFPAPVPHRTPEHPPDALSLPTLGASRLLETLVQLRGF